MKTGIELIAIERLEQIEKHGRTIDYDRGENYNFQLSTAASILCMYEPGCLTEEDIIEDHCPKGWDLKHWERLVKKPYETRLIIAGALIAAEFDRLNTRSNSGSIRLIAAASEMYDALEDIVYQFETTRVPVGPDLADSIRVLAKNVIKKIEGGDNGC